MAGTIKTVMKMMDKFVETHNKQEQLLPLVTLDKPTPSDLQNAGNVYWRDVQQHSPRQQGWDMTGNETDIIQEGVPYVLEDPWNDVVEQRIDDMRDMSYWEKRAEEAGRKLAAGLNSDIASGIANNGSLFYRSNVTSGYDFIGNAMKLMNERQLYMTDRMYVLNDADNLKFGIDIAARETIDTLPSEIWRTGLLQPQISGFRVYTGSYLPTLAGGADPATTVTADVSEKPLPGTVVNNTVVTNYDYRTATIAVTASAGYNVGDKVYFANGGTPVYALGLMDKTNTADPMTFTIVAKPTGTSVTVFPKPIAADDAALSTLEKAYANINTQILNTATMNRMNIDATNRVNLFWDRSAVTVSGGELPWEKIKEWGGNKYVTETLANGLSAYLMYDGDIITADFKYRFMVWYGVNVNNPSNAGVAVTYT